MSFVVKDMPQIQPVKCKILVTGGSGLIGRAVSEKLHQTGHEVIALGYDKSCKKDSARVDLTDISSVMRYRELVGEFDVIVHCAALAHGQVPPRGASVGDFNSLMLRNLLRAFRCDSTHWLFMSSVSVYGVYANKGKVDVFTAPSPVDDYGAGKLRDETTILSSRAHVDVFRLAPVYAEFAMKDVMKRVLLPGTKIKLRIHPSPWHSFCHLSNVVERIVDAISSHAGRQITLVADEVPVSQRDLLGIAKGISFPIPKTLALALVWGLSVLPGRSNGLAIALQKFALDSVYLPSTRSINNLNGS